MGYLKNLSRLHEATKQKRPDLIHAHYGFCGLLSALQRQVPVIVTFHGSDINVPRNRIFSFWAHRLATKSIFVHPDLPGKIRVGSKQAEVIPCGVNIETFYPIETSVARKSLGLNPVKKYILFSSSFDNRVKNYKLARMGIDLLGGDSTLIQLAGYTRQQVNLLMNAVDSLLVTSLSETGPLVVKEAVACNCPIVSTDVGDVRWLIGDTSGCYITSFDPVDVSEKLGRALEFSAQNGRTDGRNRIGMLGLDSDSITKRIINTYRDVISSQIY